MLCQGNFDRRQGKVREMSVNFVLSSLYEPCASQVPFRQNLNHQVAVEF